MISIKLDVATCISLVIALAYNFRHVPTNKYSHVGSRRRLWAPFASLRYKSTYYSTRSARSPATDTTSVRQKLEEEANEATARLEVEQKARKENEELNLKLLTEKNELVSRLESERGSMGDEIARQQKLQAQKADLESPAQREYAYV